MSTAAVPAGTGYSPAQIRHAYGVDGLTVTGAGQTIAVTVALGSPTIQSDLNTFCSSFGLPTTTITIAYPTGTPTTSDPEWALETSLDVEWAHAMAPGAKILLCVAATSALDDVLAAVDYGSAHASQVSMSWVFDEFAGETGYDTHFSKAGVSFVGASGDDGLGAEWPAASPYVTGVGGTTLSLDATGNVLSETAWSGSDGGPGSVFAEPSYQTQWQSSGQRDTPDVSCLGDPNSGVAVYDSTMVGRATGWMEIGGTSAGAAMWNGLLALARASG
jgi:subtilase family serine protease